MGGLEVIVLFVLLLMAPFIALQAYLLVWILGPAIRRAGRCWEEGRQRAVDKRARALTQADWNTRLAQSEALQTPRESEAAATEPASPAKVEPAPQHTITGRRIR